MGFSLLLTTSLRIPFGGMVVPLLESLASNGGSFLFSPYQDRGSESGRELTEEFIQPMHRAALNLSIFNWRDRVLYLNYG